MARTGCRAGGAAAALGCAAVALAGCAHAPGTAATAGSRAAFLSPAPHIPAGRDVYSV